MVCSHSARPFELGLQVYQRSRGCIYTGLALESTAVLFRTSDPLAYLSTRTKIFCQNEFHELLSHIGGQAAKAGNPNPLPLHCQITCGPYSLDRAISHRIVH